jgi:hypothetical protein
MLVVLGSEGRPRVDFWASCLTWQRRLVLVAQCCWVCFDGAVFPVPIVQMQNEVFVVAKLTVGVA